MKRVVVFRALMLGDLLCATPALRALRRGWPQAHISLVGLPWARDLAARLPSLDGYIEFAGWPGLPEVPPPRLASRLRFLDEMCERRDDLAIQLHGSGPVVNALVAAFGARRNAGFTSPGAWVPPADAASFTAWPEQGSEVERLLTLTDHLGLPRQGLQLDFPLHDDDRRAALPLLRALDGRPYVLIHAGSQLPSRRWPPERYAAVADALVRQGLAVCLSGSIAELDLTRGVAAAMHMPSTNWCGQTTLWTLGALVQEATLVLCNDTGISHIAAALGTPSVVVSSGGDAPRWAPADTTRHQVLWHDLPCRPCALVHCPIGHPCAHAVQVSDVCRAAQQAFRSTALRSPTLAAATA
jgi:ADP-heptose:LPS heptosyltransferase